MGAVSILEDIEKSLENLRHLSERVSAPTELAIVSQEKRLAREQERLQELSRKVLKVAELLRGSLDQDRMKQVKAALEVQHAVFDLRKTQKQLKAVQEECDLKRGKLKKLNDLETEVAILRGMLAARQSTTSENKNEGIANVEKLKSDIWSKHPETANLRTHLSKAKQMTDALQKDLAAEKQKTKRLQALLSGKQRPAKVR